jgi:hypothetical protein
VLQRRLPRRRVGLRAKPEADLVPRRARARRREERVRVQLRIARNPLEGVGQEGATHARTLRAARREPIDTAAAVVHPRRRRAHPGEHVVGGAQARDLVAVGEIEHGHRLPIPGHEGHAPAGRGTTHDARDVVRPSLRARARVHRHDAPGPARPAREARREAQDDGVAVLRSAREIEGVVIDPAALLAAPQIEQARAAAHLHHDHVAENLRGARGLHRPRPQGPTRGHVGTPRRRARRPARRRDELLPCAVNGTRAVARGHTPEHRLDAGPVVVAKARREGVGHADGGHTARAPKGGRGDQDAHGRSKRSTCAPHEAPPAAGRAGAAGAAGASLI